MLLNPDKVANYRDSKKKAMLDIREIQSQTSFIIENIGYEKTTMRNMTNDSSKFATDILLIREAYAAINLEESYSSLFELLWYSQIPCFDILNITTKLDQQHGEHHIKLLMVRSCIEKPITGLVKECRWKGKKISCAAIFTMQPTDRGMCCSFNKARADELFRESRFKEQVERMTNQDKSSSREDSKLPDGWETKDALYVLTFRAIVKLFILFRVEFAPDVGQSRGLDLMLDAHTNLITASSVANTFQVM